jgi:FdhD protein
MSSRVKAMVSKTLKNITCTHVDDSRLSSARERIVKETALKINVDGGHFATAMILATMEKEFITGNLFTQGIIRSTADIGSLILKNNTAEVMLSKVKPPCEKPQKVISDVKVHHEDVFECVRVILKSEVFTETEAVHSAGLFLDGKDTVCVAEDLGRHNALDKVIGQGLLQGIDFSRTLSASTGRQPSEMIYKCLNAGIPIIATKGVPTTLAIEIAEKAGITIAGLVRGNTMIIYSHPERIV